MSKSLDDIIRKVENLLRHAKSSETIGYTDEADTYLAAAQNIMMQYRIEESELFRSQHHNSGIVRCEFPIEGPYFLDKATLLNSIAKQNFCRVLQGKGYVAIYGHSSDIEFVTTLYRSLLVDMIVQMQHKFKEKQQQEVVTNTKAWKKSFFSGYASRIEQRLSQMRQSFSTQYALVSVEREHEISEFWQELTKEFSTSFRSTSSLDGFEAGKVSANDVDLGQTKISNADSVL